MAVFNEPHWTDHIAAQFRKEIMQHGDHVAALRTHVSHGGYTIDQIGDPVERATAQQHLQEQLNIELRLGRYVLAQLHHHYNDEIGRATLPRPTPKTKGQK